VGDAHGVGPLFLGDGNGHRRVDAGIGWQQIRSRTEPKPGIAGGLGRPIADAGHIIEIDGNAVDHIDHQFAEFSGRVDEIPGFNNDVLIQHLNVTGRQQFIGDIKGPGHLQGRCAPGSQGLGIQFDPDLPGSAARHLDAVGILDGLQVVLDLLCQPPQFVIAGQGRIIAPQHRHHDRNIIDFDRFNHPGLDRRRNPVNLGKHFVIDFHQRIFAIFADIKTNRHNALTGPRHRIDILDTIDLIENFFQGGGNLTLHLLRAKSGSSHEYIRHGHYDLGLFFTRRNHQSDHAAHNGNQQNQQRQRPLHGLAGQA